MNMNGKILKKKTIGIIISVFVLLVASSIYFVCRYYPTNPPYSSEINAVLLTAGDNRAELEKVLKHYGRNPADSLKLRAAEFLIANMPGKRSEYYDAPLGDVASVLLRWTSSSDKEIIKDAYGLGELIVRDDVKHIAGDYLINNIDLAFKVWEEQPWGKHIPFDAFCENILPYRVSTEPLENWRAKALASFADVNRSFGEQPDISAVEACEKVNKLLPTFRLDKDFIPMSYSMLGATTRNTCEGITSYALFVMRALGIPVTQDYTPKYPYIKSGHSWNAVRSDSGKYISFMGTETVPGKPHQGTTFIQAKIFRKTFAILDSARKDPSLIPPMYRNVCFKDVTPEYAGYGDVAVPISFPPPAGVSKNDIYLAMLDSDVRWVITGRGKSDRDSVLFSGIGSIIVYLPVYYKNDVPTPAGNPFRLDTVGKPRFFATGATQYDTLLLSEVKLVNKIAVDTWRNRMLHGVFEAANTSDFSDSVTLHTINKPPNGFDYTVAKLKSTGKFRYMRYLPPEKSYCNVSEIGVYGTDGKKLSGTPIGLQDPKPEALSINNVFDEDPKTFYDFKDAWVGLDFGEPQRIAEIRYFPRNDNFEVSYWDGTSWQSIGELNIDNLGIKVPSGVLLRLTNAIQTERQEDRVFFIDNGFQQIN
jgi:phosphohistidine swiveling domain-containing protein